MLSNRFSTASSSFWSASVMVDTFSDSQANIKRAYSKFGGLKSLVNRYIRETQITVREETKSDCVYTICRINDLPPEDIQWDAVEIIHRLRNALDKAVVAMVERNGIGLSGVNFPFGGIDGNTGEPNVFPSAGTEKSLKKKFTAEQWDFIVNVCKPYPGGNDTLWTINEIANFDKHRKGIVTVRPTMWPSTVRIVEGDQRGGGSYRLMPTDCDHMVSDKEAETVIAEFSGPGYLKVEQELSIDVVFGEITPVANKNVLVTLNQSIRMVDGLVKAMRPLVR